MRTAGHAASTRMWLRSQAIRKRWSGKHALAMMDAGRRSLEEPAIVERARRGRLRKSVKFQGLWNAGVLFRIRGLVAGNGCLLDSVEVGLGEAEESGGLFPGTHCSRSAIQNLISDCRVTPSCLAC